MTTAAKKRGRTKKVKEMHEFSPEDRDDIFHEKVRGVMWDVINLDAFKKKVRELAEECLVPVPSPEWWYRLKEAGCRPKTREDMFWDGTLGMVDHVHFFRRWVKVDGKKREGFFKCYQERLFPKGTIVFLKNKKNDVWELHGEYRKNRRVS